MPRPWPPATRAHLEERKAHRHGLYPIRAQPPVGEAGRAGPPPGPGRRGVRRRQRLPAGLLQRRRQPGQDHHPAAVPAVDRLLAGPHRRGAGLFQSRRPGRHFGGDRRQLRCVTCTETETAAAESVIVNNDFLAKYKDAVTKLGRAIAQGTLFGATNPQAALAIMKKVNPEEQVNAEFAKVYFTKAVEIMKPRQPNNQYGWQDPAVYQRSMDLLLTPGIPAGLTAKIDLGAFVDNDLVPAYNQFDHDAVVQDAKNAKT